MNGRNLEDVLVVAADFSSTDSDMLMVGRRKDNGDFEIVKLFTNNEAVELYNRLIGNDCICMKCSHYVTCAWKDDKTTHCKEFRSLTI